LLQIDCLRQLQRAQFGRRSEKFCYAAAELRVGLMACGEATLSTGVAASEARAVGWGGVATVAKITGVSRKRITAGLKDLAAPSLDPGRVRRKGGGRRPRSLP